MVRFPAYCAVPLPDGVSDEVGSLLEPLAVGLHALDRGHARAGERLVVIGYGPVGAATALLGRSLGLDPLVCELSPGRLARAADHGFETHAPEPEKKDFAKAVRGLTGGGAGIIVDCTGAVPALEAALEMSERGGRIVCAGIPKKPVAVDAGRMVLYERELIATLGYANDLPRVAAMIASGALDPSVMITNRITLAEVPAEIESMAADPRDEVKVLAEVRSMSPAATGTVVPMPHMGVSIDEGTVIAWHKAVGDTVAEGDVICEIATDKVDMEVEAPAGGTITAIFAEADAVVPVGEALCELDGDASAATGGGSPGATPRGESEADASGVEGASGGVPGDPPPASAPGSGDVESDIAGRAAAGRDANGGFDPAAAADAVTSLPGVLASPLAKRIASERGVDLGSVTGTGKRGRIRKDDVLAAAAAGPGAVGSSAAVRGSAPAAGGGPSATGARPQAAPLGAGDGGSVPAGYDGVPHEVVPTTRVRQAIAEHMIRSRQTAAHMTTEVDVDLTSVVRARTELNKARLAAGDAEALLPAVHRPGDLRGAGRVPRHELDLPGDADDPLGSGQPRDRGRHRGGAAGPRDPRRRVAHRSRDRRRDR